MPSAKRPSLSRSRHAVALAALTFDLAPALAAAGEANHITIQVLPAGQFMPSDGRPMDSPPWNIGTASAAAVIAQFDAINARQPLVIDYEHQTLHKEKNGQPAPAAAWFRSLSWREGQGLFAQVELTARARDAIGAKEYLYFSPVFTYDRSTGMVTSIQMGALTNNPGIHGMPPLSATAAATAVFLSPDHQEPPVNLLLKALLQALGLPETTTEEQATAALTALNLSRLQGQATAACTALNLSADASPETLSSALARLRTATPDPAQYVPIAVVNDLRNGLAALTARQIDADVDARVKPALGDGRLLAGMEAWARDLGKKDLAALDAFLASAQPIAALTSTQTNGQPPGSTGMATGGAQLSDAELAVCTATGITTDQYKAAAPAKA